VIASTDGFLIDRFPCRRSSPDSPDLDSIRAQSTTMLVPRHSLLVLQVTHQSPALLGELYPLNVHIKNTEESIAEKLTLEVSLLLSPDDQHQERSSKYHDFNPLPPSDAFRKQKILF